MVWDCPRLSNTPGGKVRVAREAIWTSTNAGGAVTPRKGTVPSDTVRLTLAAARRFQCAPQPFAHNVPLLGMSVC